MENQNNVVNINYDLGILSLFDSNAVKFDISPGTSEFEKNLKELSLKNIKLLMQNFYSLKSRKEDAFDDQPDDLKLYDYNKSQFEINLPPSTTVFPRQKTLPAVKKLTRWEKFAKDKGIKKKKRSRLVYDELNDTWVPRWGAHSIKKIQDKADGIRVAKPGDDPNADPFEKKSLAKTMHKEKQNLREMKNKLEAKGIKASAYMKQDQKEVNKSKTKKTKKGVAKMLEIAQKSTASMGLFDKKAHKEEPEIKKKRKNNVQPFKNGIQEKQRNLDILEYVSKVKASK